VKEADGTPGGVFARLVDKPENYFGRWEQAEVPVALRLMENE
jgi:hypothetical protein